MKVLVRDDNTRLYSGDGGQWVAQASEARDFATLQKAGEAARECRSDMSVVLAYEDPPCELALNPEYCM